MTTLPAMTLLAMILLGMPACRRAAPTAPQPAPAGPPSASVGLPAPASPAALPAAATPLSQPATPATAAATSLPTPATVSGREGVFGLDDGPRVLADLRHRLAVPLAGLATGPIVDVTRVEPTGRRVDRVEILTDRLVLRPGGDEVAWVWDAAGCHVELGTVRALCDVDDERPLGVLAAAVVLARLEQWPDARIESLQVGRDGSTSLRVAIPALKFRFALTALPAASPTLTWGTGGVTGRFEDAGLVLLRNRGAGWTWQPGRPTQPPTPRAVLKVAPTTQDFQALGLATAEVQARRGLVAAGPDEVVVEHTDAGVQWRAWQIPVVAAADFAPSPQGSVVVQPQGALEQTVTVPMEGMADALAEKLTPGCHVLQLLGHTRDTGLLFAVRKCPP